MIAAATTSSPTAPASLPSTATPPNLRDLTARDGGESHANSIGGMQPNRVANVSVSMMGAKEGVRVAGVGPSGTDHALAAVYRSHYGALVGTARLLLDDRESAEEVVQEAFARTWAAFDRLRDPGDPLPYVRRAVVNLARSGLRRRRTARKTPLQAVPDAVAADVTFAHAEARRELATCGARASSPATRVCRAPLLPRLLDGGHGGGARHRRRHGESEPAPRAHGARCRVGGSPMTFTEQELRVHTPRRRGPGARGDGRRLVGCREAACAPAPRSAHASRGLRP